MWEILNPKSALFFFTFLPQFTDPAAALPVGLQIVVLGLAVNVIFTLSDALLVETSHRLTRHLGQSSRVVFCLQRLGGGLLIALGVKLALARPQ